MTFTDLYLRAETRDELDGALVSAGIVEGAPGVAFDRIGPFFRLVHYDSDGEPVWAHFDEYHANVRLSFALTPEQAAAIEPFRITTPSQPFRRWS